MPCTRPARSLRPGLAAIAGCLLTSLAFGQEPALRGFDPVALCAGNEEQGQVEFATEHEGYVYHFASKERLETFHTQPERYCIQLGGACARMGSHSGRGQAKRYWVYKERIYIFASDACRAGFQKDPDACLDQRIAKPKASGKPGWDASEVIAAARKAHGVDKLPPFSFELEATSNKTTTKRRFRVRDADSVRVDTEYVQGAKVWKYAKATSPKSSFFIDEGDARPMCAAAQHEMRATLWREPIVALHRSEQAIRGKSKRIAGIAVDEVSVWIDGTLTHFGIDAQNRIRTARFRGRGPDYRFTEVTKIYEDLTDVAGVLVPMTVRTLMAGKERPELAERRRNFAVGKPIPAAAFEARK